MGSKATKVIEKAQGTEQTTTDCLGKTLAPNPSVVQPAWYEGMDESLTYLALLSDQGKGKESPKNPDLVPKPQIDKEHDIFVHLVNQPTLVRTWNPGLEDLIIERGEIGIFAHGPSHLGGRTALHIHQ